MYTVDLSGRIAVVTGGSRGIGRFIAEALHVVGAKVAITGREATTLETEANEIGENCFPFVCDQRNAEAIGIMAGQVNDELGAPDILVNNAGIMPGGVSVVELRLDQWNDTIATNLTGAFLVTQAFLPGMIEKRGGDIFMMSSTSGKKGDPGWAAYSATKFGLQGFAQSLVQEVRSLNIRVSVLNPSTVSTDPDVGSTEGEGLHIHAADVAATVVHLCGLPRRTMVRDIDIWGTNP